MLCIYTRALVSSAWLPFFPPLPISLFLMGKAALTLFPPADHSPCQSVCILSFAAGSLKQLSHSLWTLLYLPALITKLLIQGKCQHHLAYIKCGPTDLLPAPGETFTGCAEIKCLCLDELRGSGLMNKTPLRSVGTQRSQGPL